MSGEDSTANNKLTPSSSNTNSINYTIVLYLIIFFVPLAVVILIFFCKKYLKCTHFNFNRRRRRRHTEVNNESQATTVVTSNNEIGVFQISNFNLNEQNKPPPYQAEFTQNIEKLPTYDELQAENKFSSQNN